MKRLIIFIAFIMAIVYLAKLIARLNGAVVKVMSVNGHKEAMPAQEELK